jgi:hypothetical protein
MHIAKYYSAKHKTAYIILGHCKDFGQRALEVEYFEMETQCKVPPKCDFNEIALGPHQHMTIIKFSLETPTPIRRPGHEPPWLPVEDHLDKLRPKYQ